MSVLEDIGWAATELVGLWRNGKGLDEAERRLRVDQVRRRLTAAVDRLRHLDRVERKRLQL